MLERPNDADARRQLQAWLEKYQQNDNYDAIRLLDAHGVARMSVPADLPPVSSVVLQRIPETLRSRQGAFQDFYRNEYDQRIYLGLLIPIVDQQNAGRPLGILYRTCHQRRFC